MLHRPVRVRCAILTAYAPTTAHSLKSPHLSAVSKTIPASTLLFLSLLFSLTLFALPASTHADNTGLVGYWKFDDGTGTQATDFSGNGNTGTTTARWVSGKHGKALQFDGSTNYVGLGNSSSLQLSNGTMSIWFKGTTCTGDGTYCALVTKQNVYGLYVRTNGHLILYDFSASTERDTGINVLDGKWHQATATFQSGVNNGSIIYLDGAAVLTTTMTIVSQGFSVEIARGGTSAPTQLFNGTIDDVRIYNRALSATEVAKLYTAGRDTPQTPLQPRSRRVLEI